jgi:hypothetical protein
VGRRKPGKYPYDYTPGDDGRFLDSGAGGTLRVLHGPGRGMGVTEGVTCRVEVLGADGALLDEAWAGKLGKEHRLRRTVAGDAVDVTVTARFDPDDGDELTATRTVVLTGDLDDVIRFGVGPGWEQVAGLDAGELPWQPTAPTSSCWGAGVRLRGARPATAEDDHLDALTEHAVRTPLDDLD